MTISADIRHGDVVSFSPHPRFFSGLREIIKLAVALRISDGSTTYLGFDFPDGTRQVMLPNNHPVEIHRHAG